MKENTEKKEKKEVHAKPVNKEKQAGQGKKKATSSGQPEQKGPAKKQIKFKSFLFEKYRTEMVPHLMQKFGYKNKMQIPALSKVVINTCLKEAVSDSKILDVAVAELATITGQRPVITKAKKSISNFKLRVGLPIGACVTLRNNMMYEFVNRFVNVTLPRVRDFRGVSSKGFDGRGNYTLGLTEQTIFPEIDFDKVTNVHGMNITFVTTAKTDAESKELLTLLGVPFRK